ncbi:bifunctional diguanylate cyclase/phosphodiesterase [Alteromonas sp. PRIM-21]|uniref:bifunctional diguanylate cyclase/phosphodiesterase n=1 Tax=Alteromonas sp. PRIM-21 TaxID=1454978 RepID=UPI0022B98ACE|nr:EAL domain-containing protein [Alteromonas sp. PRIM-21]MCZ8528607.1 EAL domain-containing protein [Alteromonas sp. PRIM-21]
MFRRSSFFTKQLLAVLAVNFFSLCLVAGLLYNNFVADYKSNLVDVLDNQSTLLASAASTSVLFSDVETTQELLDAASKLPAIKSAKVYDDAYTVIASYAMDDFEEDTSPSTVKEGATFGKRLIHYLKPIEFNDEVIGYLILTASTTSLEEQQQHAMYVVLGVLIVSMLFTYLFHWRLQSFLSKPIQQLISLVKFVGSKREYSKRLPDKRDDELGELFEGVNHILATVESHQAQLKAQNTELERVVELRTRQLYQKANYDALTQLPNRHLFVEKLDEAVNKANAQNSALSILFLDLDRFKLINDTLGHDIGDEVLIIVAKKLAAIVTEEDCVCRWGGDEFVIMLEGVAEHDELVALSSEIIESLSQPMAIGSNQLHISTSIGIALHQRNLETGIEILKHADTSMYHAKEKGPGHFSFFNIEMLEESLVRLSLESRIRQAIKLEGAFSLVYQPQISIRSDKIIGLESLIRWNDEGTDIAPSQFIPVAEEAGLINPLTTWVLENVCQQIRKWLDEGLNLVPVAVNLPASFLIQLDCAEQIEEVLSKYQVPPHLLEVELTENTFISSTDFALTSLKKLKKIGLNISIDDFGTGYSCLSYIGTLPINKLKIDGSFVSQLGQSSSNDGIVNTIIMLAKSLELTTLGECVETKEQQQALAEMGCDSIQGYLHHKPLKSSEVAPLMSRH